MNHYMNGDRTLALEGIVELNDAFAKLEPMLWQAGGLRKSH
ncbi:hypothetical protein [Methylomarinum vadi]|nr:hypothetical protein [Methylomarinum vadi]